MWRWRRGLRTGPGRPMKPRIISFEPREMAFGPIPLPTARNPIIMGLDEYEAFRLIYYEGLKQEEAAERMGVSRGTIWRCLENARRKIAAMFAERRSLVITASP